MCTRMASAKYGAFDSGSDYDGDGGLMLAGRRYCGRLHVPNWSFHYKARFQAHLSLGGGRAGAGVGVEGGAGGSSSGRPLLETLSPSMNFMLSPSVAFNSTTG